jgi:flagellar hook-associated protein 2
MGTIGSSLTSPVTTVSSSNSSSNSSSTSAANSSSGMFTGASAYSADLQNVISRAVQIASLPITVMQSQQTSLNAQSSELNTMDGLFSNLQTAVQGIQTAMNGSSFQSDISNPSVVGATLGDGAVEGVYSIDVKDIGAYATSMTAKSWDATESSPGKPDTYNLVIGNKLYAINPADDSAASVASAINSQYGSLVNATVVNVGSSATPDYRVALQSTTLGAMSLDIQTSQGASLQKQQTAGSLAQYVVDNSGNTVTSNSRSVTISTGVTLQLNSSDPGNPVDVTVTRSTSALSDALTSFAGAYNAVAKEINGQRGQSGGALQGQSILTQLQRTLSGISTYSSTGQISGLTDLGLNLNNDGTLTYNQWTLMAADIGNSSAVTGFLGAADTGGFLQSVTTALNNLEDSSTGLLKNAETAMQSQIKDVGDQITAKQNQVAQLQTSLTNQMAAADAMISTIQQQYQEISSMFSAMDTANQMYAK